MGTSVKLHYFVDLKRRRENGDPWDNASVTAYLNVLGHDGWAVLVFALDPSAMELSVICAKQK